MSTLRRRLGLLSAHLVVAVIALVVIGGATRVMEAGLACPDWPLCFGSFLPGRQMNVQVFLEWFLFSDSRPYFDNPKTQKPLVKSRVATAFDKGFLNLIMAIRKGLEPSTSCVTGRHSNQLNYRTAGG